MIEMAVTMAVFAILVAMAVPSFGRWVANNKVRTTADSLQNVLRTAQVESLRRSRQVVLTLTTSADGKSVTWALNTISAATGDAATVIESGNLTATAPGITVQGPAAICFNSMGRLTANDGATCTLPGTPPIQKYRISAPAPSDRPLQVIVSLGGQVHMCDPAKTLSSTNPDGCPTGM
jgi:type IV fimbrial biogenesis protein FimT